MIRDRKLQPLYGLKFNPFLSAEKRVSFNRVTFFFRDFTQLFHFKGITDATTCAYIYTILFIHG